MIASTGREPPSKAEPRVDGEHAGRKPTTVEWQDAYSLIEPLMDNDGIYSWPFDSLFSVDVRFYRFNRRNNFRLNRHDHFELLYVLQGEMAFQIHKQNFNVRAGDMLVIGSTFFHRPLRLSSSRTKAAVLYFLSNAVLGNGSSSEDVEYLRPFLAQGTDFPHLIEGRTGIPAKILELMKSIYAELPAKSIRNRVNVKAYLKMILVLLGNHYSSYQVSLSQFRRRQESINRLRPVMKFLDEHIGEPVTVADAASIVHMSKSHFMHLFRKVTGQAFVTYMNQLRIARAEELLAATDIPIADLCQQVGFCDQSYFGVVFRKLVGTAPGRYRAQFAGAPVDGAGKGGPLDGLQSGFECGRPAKLNGHSPRTAHKQVRRPILEGPAR